MTPPAYRTTDPGAAAARGRVEPEMRFVTVVLVLAAVADVIGAVRRGGALSGLHAIAVLVLLGVAWASARRVGRWLHRGDRRAHG